MAKDRRLLLTTSLRCPGQRGRRSESGDRAGRVRRWNRSLCPRAQAYRSEKENGGGRGRKRSTPSPCRNFRPFSAGGTRGDRRVLPISSVNISKEFFFLSLHGFITQICAIEKPGKGFFFFTIFYSVYQKQTT